MLVIGSGLGEMKNGFHRDRFNVRFSEVITGLVSARAKLGWGYPRK